jgi:hypothetical protein
MSRKVDTLGAVNAVVIANNWARKNMIEYAEMMATCNISVR